MADTVADYTDSLYDVERNAVASAVASRRAEFSTGRVLARRGLCALGYEAQAVPRGSHNEPVWPAGAVGSITHAGDECAVVVAHSARWAGLGLDIEKRDANVSDIAYLVLHDEEALVRRSLPRNLRDDFVRLTFSAKEAVFKAVFGEIRRIIEFEEVVLSFDDALQSFSATAPANPALQKALGAGAGHALRGTSLVATVFQIGCGSRP